MANQKITADNDNERVFLKFFETLSSGDLGKLRDLFHEEIIWQVQPKGIAGEGSHHGKQAIIEFLAPLRGLFNPGEPRLTVTSIASKGAFVIGETTGKGTFLDGRPYDNLYVWALEIKDGKVYRLREYMDSLYIAKLQGVAK